MLRLLLLVVPFLLGLSAERAIRRLRPLWLTPFAIVPIGRRRRVPLTRSPYRTPASDPGHLPLSDREGSGVHVESVDDLAAVSSPTHSGLARIDVRYDQDVAVLRARCLPVPISLLASSGFLLVIARGSLLALAIAVLAPLLIGAATMRRLRPQVDEALDELSRRL